jgi:NAD(P)H-flavin reductase
MQTGKGQVLELMLEDGSRYVRVSCPPNLIPSPGQYVLAGDGSASTLLPIPLFHTDSAPQGFIAEGPVNHLWNPGQELQLRGPLGQGFTLPGSARKVGLVAFDVPPARLRGLIQPALKQGMAVVLVCSFSPDNLPSDVEVQPMSALGDVIEWADYVAFDVERENLPLIRERMGKPNQFATAYESQVLIRTPVPCGGVADCGVCAVTLTSGWKMACRDGPVFDWREIG